MAYNRKRDSYQSQSQSEEDAHLTSPSSAALPPLAPPRPFFIGSKNQGDRGSYSSADSSIVEGSDSDREQATHAASSAVSPAAQAQPRARNHRRRSTNNNYAVVDARSADTPPPPPGQDPFASPVEQQQWSPAALYNQGGVREEPRNGPLAPQPVRSGRLPPSSFAFPFQAYPGNPDPGTNVPGSSRRSSIESLRRPNSAGDAYGQPAYGPNGYNTLAMASPSVGDLQQQQDYGRPHPPFMSHGGSSSNSPLEMSPDFGHSRRASSNSLTPPNLGGSTIFQNSAAAAAAAGLASPSAYSSSHGHGDLPRVASVGTFRAPFLSPASRPTSSMWTPPAYTYGLNTPGSAAGSVVGFGGASGLKHRPPMPSSRLANKLTREEKPWLAEKDSAGRVSWWVTVAVIFIGVAGAGVLCWRGYVEVPRLQDSKLCVEYVSNFAGGESLDNSDTWTRVAGLGGFGNGEFEIMTNDAENSYIQNGKLYIRPTLTDQTGVSPDEMVNGFTYDLGDACADKGNQSTCKVTSSNKGNNPVIIPPVKSARLSTQGKKSIAYGRVEVKAKLPRGDWLWPAIWMLPENADDSNLPYYGRWPMSGEIDIMEARGNGPTYPAQGNNVARASMNYGVLPGTQARIFGWQEFKRQSLASDFHTYALEWTPEFMRFYVDTRLQAMLMMHPGKQSFFDRGNFPKTAKNGSEVELPITNIWSDGGNSAPFNQKFHLIISLAAGGTSGWFPDGYGGKPWYDTSGNQAMIDFYANQTTWSKTWPDNDDRSLIIESVKMYKFCKQP